MKNKVQSREELIQELQEQRERVRQLFERLNRDHENVQSREELIMELQEQRERVRRLLDQLNRDYEQVERELKSSKERLMAIVQASPLALISLDLDGAVTLWNPAAERMFGWREEEVMGKPLPYVTEAMRQEHLALRHRVLSGEAFSGVEVRRCRKDGSSIDLSISTAPLRDSRGSVDGIMSLNQDITERKRLREEFLEEKHFSEAVINSLPGLFFIFDDKGCLIKWNRNLETLSGYSSEEIRGMTALQFVSKEAEEAATRAIREVFDRGEGQVEANFLRKDGKEVPCLFTGKRIRLEGKWFLAGMAIDISKRQAAEEALIRNEALLRKSQEIGHIGSWERDLVANRLTWSDEVYRIFGVDPEAFSVSVESFLEAVHPDDRDAVNAIYLESIRSGVSTFEIEHRLVRGDNGEVRFVLERCEHVKDAAGSIVRSVGMVQDITEQKRAEAALRESEERFSVFMSHLPASAFIKDIGGRIVFANPYVQELFGIRDYAGKTMQEIIPGELAVQIAEDDLRALEQGVISVQETLRDSQGCERIFRVLKFPIHITGKPVLLGGIALDITGSTRTEAALLESKERMSHALRAADAGAWEWNMRTNKAVWSDENYLVMGLEPRSVESTYDNWLRMVHPEDRAEADRLVTDAVRNRSDLDISFRVVWPDGSVHWIIDRGKLVYDGSGEPLGMYGIQIDITDRKLADLALKESERNYREIFNGTQDTIFIHDPETGAILDANQGMLDMYGYSREEAAQLTINDLSLGVVPYDQRKALEALRKAPAEGPQVFEWLARRKNGELFWAEVVLKGTTIGGASRVLAVVRDIDERKRSQEQIRRKEEYYRSLFENAMDIVTILGADGTILYESPSVERIVGFRPEELVGLNGFSLIHPEDVEPIREIFERLARNPGSIERGEFRFRHKDGSWRILEAIGNNLLQDPAVGAIVLNERDVTDRRDAEQRLRISLKEKEILLREVHHRVKNNLQVISSLLDLQSANLDDPRLREAFRDSKQRVKTMAMIHEKLYGTGDFSSIMLSGYVEDLVQAIVEANRPGGSVAVRCDVPAIPLSVNAAVPCSLIINELVSNCLKHAFAGGRNGRIRVSVQSTEDGRLTLAVEDDGPGLPEHFDIDGTRSLGLTIVKALVKQLNGTMEIERGAGARFRITFSDKA